MNAPLVSKNSSKPGWATSKNCKHDEIRPFSMLRILVVAEDMPSRQRNKSALQEAGYWADSESDSEAAWAALQLYNYELLVVDQKLKGRSGLRLVLKMSHRNRMLPIVLVTEDLWAFDCHSHQMLQMVTVLSHPFGLEQLVKIISDKLSTPHDCVASKRRPVLLEDCPLRSDSEAYAELKRSVYGDRKWSSQ